MHHFQASQKRTYAMCDLRVAFLLVNRLDLFDLFINLGLDSARYFLIWAKGALTKATVKLMEVRQKLG